MILEDRIDAFKKLGIILRQPEGMSSINKTMQLAILNNPWFTPDNIRFSFLALSRMLEPKKLHSWIGSYNIIDKNKRIAVIVPSNIPLVGFFDFFCVLLSGSIYLGKLSSSNDILLPYLASILIKINPQFRDYIKFDDNLNDIDLLITTGSDNSTQYFQRRYCDITKITRNHRNGVAVLSGMESVNDYNNLACDVFRYFGLGCRSVSKIFVPLDFNFDELVEVFKNCGFFEPNSEYIDNYNYQKSLCIINDIKFINCTNLILVQSKKIDSPISLLYYDYYENTQDLMTLLNTHSEQVQCVVSQKKSIKNAIPLGLAQQPTLYDFPDGIDVVKFINEN